MNKNEQFQRNFCNLDFHFLIKTSPVVCLLNNVLINSTETVEWLVAMGDPQHIISETSETEFQDISKLRFDIYSINVHI